MPLTTNMLAETVVESGDEVVKATNVCSVDDELSHLARSLRDGADMPDLNR